MEESQRRVLNDSLTFLKDNLLIIDLLDHLLEKNIITQDLRQRINYEITDGSRVAELMRMLPKRGHQAFGVFLQACRATSQDHVADHLEAGLTAIKEQQYSSKTDFYTPEIILYHITLNKVHSVKRNFKTLFLLSFSVYINRKTLR